jgi:hypothetical protein
MDAIITVPAGDTETKEAANLQADWYASIV